MRSAIAVVLIFASFQSLDCLHDTTNSRLNYFDVDLLRYSAEDKVGNVMVSPASIKSTLAMLLEGARGTTAAEIRTALRLSPNKEDFREELSFFLQALEVNISSTSLQNANGLFVSKKLQLKKDYEMMAKRYYFSEVNKMDFTDPKTAANAINGWVSGKTQGLIPTIIDQANIDPQTELVVTNALYFKSAWKHEFDPKLTHGDCFYRDGVCKTVAMMDLEVELNYAFIENLRAHALELPYQGDQYSMILLVPQDRDAGVALIRDLPYIGLLQISNMMEPTNVILTMPKFTVEYSDDMVATLKKMRISSVFDPSANLSGIFEGSSTACLKSFFHKVYMSVDEKGTVAAAASAVMVMPLINDQVQLRVDRPFLFFIRDNAKGLVLFEGKIEEPTEFVAVNKKDESPQKQPISDRSEVSQSNAIQHISRQPNPIQAIPIMIDPVVSRPVSSQQAANPPITNPPISNEPIPERTSTSAPSRRSGGWYKKISGYFG